jgi:N4-gp56 family major capsid protein
VEPLTDIISPNPNVGTEGIEEAYFALCHSFVEPALRDLGDDFVKVAHYPNHMKALPGEIGAVEGVRFIRSNYLDPNLGAGDTTTAVRNTTGAADVYSILFFGKGAFGVTKLAGTEFNKVIIKNPGSSGSSDPMNQRGSAAWVGWHACKILEQSYMARLETAVPKLTV